MRKKGVHRRVGCLERLLRKPSFICVVRDRARLGRRRLCGCGWGGRAPPSWLPGRKAEPRQQSNGMRTETACQGAIWLLAATPQKAPCSRVKCQVNKMPGGVFENKGEGSGQGLASCAGTEFGQTTTKKAAGCMESNAHFLRDRDLLAGNTKGLC